MNDADSVYIVDVFVMYMQDILLFICMCFEYNQIFSLYTELWGTVK